MKIVSLEQAVLDTCIKEAQHERLILTSKGKPVALMVGIEDMDEEQLQLARSGQFWKLITQRRMQKTVSRLELEQRINRKTT
jgi:antitoxin (DNA-binding transcriptional repressor) of toxin-antitoxin stability system